MAGSNANPGSAAAPKQNLSGFNLDALPAGTTLLFKRGGAWAMNATGLSLAFGHVVAGTIWTLFHILVIVLQAFIFMMLTLIYIGQAHDHH